MKNLFAHLLQRVAINSSRRWWLALLGPLLLSGGVFIWVAHTPRTGAAAQDLAAATKLSDGVRQQIKALLDEKAARTPAQQKLDSQLLYALKMRRGEEIATGVRQLSVRVTSDAEAKTIVDITTLFGGTLLEDLEASGAELIGIYPQYHALRARVPLDRLEEIAALPQVRFIQPQQEPHYLRYSERSVDLPPGFFARVERVRNFLAGTLNHLLPQQDAPERLQHVSNGILTGSKASEGDATHRAAAARALFGTNGAGVRVGVLSDGVTNLAASQASSDLANVTVLPGQAGAGDEGTAMLEIIHDLAPGARLFFATASGGAASFAQNIRALRAAGCDIILDDVGYLTESPFQDGQAPGVISPTIAGVITQAVNDVTAAGALYFSSAGNEGNKTDNTSGTWEGDFLSGGTLANVPGGDVNDFGGGVQFDTITATGGAGLLFWSDPLGASNNDYDLFVLNSTGTSVVASSTNVQSGTQDPFEGVGAGVTTNNRLVILRKTGAAPRFLHLEAFNGVLAISTAGQTHGHSAAAAAFSVGATPAANAAGPAPNLAGPFPNPFNPANKVELFSSDGPRRLFFAPNGTPFTPGDVSATGGILRQKPDITAADGVTVTGVGGFPTRFFGTSAAAPHAGAIAALLKSANPALTNTQLRNALVNSAIDIEAAGVDRNAGAGIVMAFEALQFIGAAPAPNLEIGNVVASESGGNSNALIEPGESAMLSVQLLNTGVVNATGITATLSTTTPGVNITLSTSAYANLAAPNGAAVNTTPFTFALNPDAACPLRVEFSLTVNFAGGGSPRTLNFSVQTGPPPVVITSRLDPTAPAAGPGFTATTGLQTARLTRDGDFGACGAVKQCPGVTGSGTRRFDAYTFTTCPASAASCIEVTLSTPCGAAAANTLFAAAYLGNFTPNSLCANYLADAGVSPTATGPTSFSFTVPSGSTFTIVVNEVNDGGGLNCNYKLNVSGLCCQLTSACPSVTGFNPATAAPGGNVTLTGANLIGVTGVRFANDAAAAFTVNSSSQLTATVPTNAVTGPVTISRPGCPDTQSTAFAVLTCPSVTSLSPTAGSIGGAVTINGANFTGVNSVKFNSDVAATFSVNASGTQITATVPSGALTGVITIGKPGCNDVQTTLFTVAPCATVTGINPTSGPPSSSVLISGTNLIGTSGVRFANNQSATFTILSNTQIAALVPANAVNGPLTLSKSGCSDVQTAAFSVTAGTPSELSLDDASFEQRVGLTNGGDYYVVNRITPTSYPATLAAISIFLTDLNAGDSIGLLTAANPSGNTGISGTVFNRYNATVQTPEQFNLYAVPALTITQGDFLVGAVLTHPAGKFPAAIDTTPPSKLRSYRAVDGVNFTLLDNVNPAFAGNLGIRARITTPAAQPVCPTVSNIAPASGATGSTVTITGTNFTGVNAVKFATTATATFTVNSATSITATVPAGAITGPITISKTGCTDVQTASFTVTQPCPTITLAPATLPDGTGGTAYNQTLTASGGTAPYSFAVTAGALPGGLTLTTGGALAGTPNVAGTFNFTVTATDANGCTGTRSYTVNNTVTLGAQTRALYVLNDKPSGNQIYGYAVNETTGALTLLSGFPITTGGNGGGTPIDLPVTQQLTIDRTNQRLYAINAGSNTVSAYSINSTTGALTPLPFSPINLGGGFWTTMAVHLSGSPLVVGDGNFSTPKFLSYQITATTATAAVGSPYSTSNAFPLSTAFSQDGNFIYTGGGANSTTAGFSVNATTGVLTTLAGSPFNSGGVPLAYATDIAGRLFVANFRDGQVRVFTTLNGIPNAVSGNPFTSGLSFAAYGLLHPNGFYLVTDRGSLGSAPGNRVGVYRMNGSGSATTLDAISGSPFSAGGILTEVLTLNQAGTFLFAVNGLSRNLTTFSVNPTTGALTLLGTQPANSLGASDKITGMAYFAQKCPTITLSPTTLPSGTVGTAYNQTITASPSVNYNFSVTAGALPAGLSLNAATGAITGTPTTAGTANFTITALSFGPCSGSQAYALTINNPLPIIASLSPAAATAGGAGFTLTVNGTNFVNSSVVRWNGSDRPTAFVDSTRLTAQIPASDIASAGTATLTVFTPSPGGGTSNAASFTINNPLPTVTSLNPSSATAGGAGFTLTVNGSNFVNSSVVQWQGSNRATTFVNATQLTAAITAADIATAGTASVTVVNPAPGGGTSNTQSFTIIQPNPAPALTSLDPNTRVAGSAGFTLTLNGTGFIPASQVKWNGADRLTNFTNNTRLTIDVPASDIASAGTAALTVTNPAPGGGVSNALSFTITQPNQVPTLTSLDPNSRVAGSAAFTLNLNGTNFVNGSVVRWNNADRATTFVSSTRLSATIPASDLALPGTASVTVFNPAPGGGVSNALSFAIGSAVASISAASFSAAELAADSIIAAFGADLATQTQVASVTPLPTTLAGTTVRVRDSLGAERLAPLFFVSAGQVNYLMPAGTANGAALVTITNSNGKASVGTAQLATVAPGLFTANSNGQGVPAAFALRVKANGAQSGESIAQLAGGSYVPAPIDLGPDGEQVFLILFGTGFRAVSGLSNVTARIGGTNAEVSFAGAQGDLAGLDQANVKIPRSLIGRGEVEVVLTMDGKAANTVRVNVR